LMILPPPTPTLFPYTTLFRSRIPPAANVPVGVGRVVCNMKADQKTFAAFDLAGFERQRVIRPARIAGECQASFGVAGLTQGAIRSEEHTSELQSRGHLVCRLL